MKHDKTHKAEFRESPSLEWLEEQFRKAREGGKDSVHLILRNKESRLFEFVRTDLAGSVSKLASTTKVFIDRRMRNLEVEAWLDAA